MVSSQADRGTRHCASERMLGLIVFGVQNQILIVKRTLSYSEWMLQVCQLNRLFSLAQCLDRGYLGPEGALLSLPGAF